MPRNPRSYIKTSYYHIITQGINKNYIFAHPEDIKNYIKNMYKLKDEHKIEIIAYCIMNNHAHILIKTEMLNELSKYMQRINTKYAIYYNKKYNKVGYVFRDRYKSEGIYSEEHLYNCIKYIYNNPVKAGICNRPEDYKYSNYKEIMEEFPENEEYIFIDVNEEKDDICKKVINEFLVENNIKLKNFKSDKKRLRQLLIILKDKYNISLRDISKELNIARETIRNIYKYWDIEETLHKTLVKKLRPYWPKNLLKLLQKKLSYATILKAKNRIRGRKMKKFVEKSNLISIKLVLSTVVSFLFIF